MKDFRWILLSMLHAHIRNICRWCYTANVLRIPTLFTFSRLTRWCHFRPDLLLAYIYLCLVCVQLLMDDICEYLLATLTMISPNVYNSFRLRFQLCVATSYLRRHDLFHIGRRIIRLVDIFAEYSMLLHIIGVLFFIPVDFNSFIFIPQRFVSSCEAVTPPRSVWDALFGNTSEFYLLFQALLYPF